MCQSFGELPVSPLPRNPIGTIPQSFGKEPGRRTARGKLGENQWETLQVLQQDAGSLGSLTLHSRPSLPKCPARSKLAQIPAWPTWNPGDLGLKMPGHGWRGSAAQGRQGGASIPWGWVWQLHPCQEGPSSSPDTPSCAAKPVPKVILHLHVPYSCTSPHSCSFSPFQEFRPAFLSFPLPGTLELSLAGDTARPHLAQHPQGSCSHFPGEELNLLPPQGAPGSPDFILCLIIAICCSQLRGCLLPLGLWLSQAHWISLLCGLLAHFPGDAPIPF